MLILLLAKVWTVQETCEVDLKTLYVWCMSHRFALVEKSLSTFSILNTFEGIIRRFVQDIIVTMCLLKIFHKI